MIIDEWKTLVLNSATILESINEMIARKHIQKHNATYDDKIIDIFVELIRSLLNQDLCAIQVRQKLVISDMSRRHWIDERKVLWHDDCVEYYEVIDYLEIMKRKMSIKYRFDELIVKQSFNYYESLANFMSIMLSSIKINFMSFIYS